MTKKSKGDSKCRQADACNQIASHRPIFFYNQKYVFLQNLIVQSLFSLRILTADVFLHLTKIRIPFRVYLYQREYLKMSPSKITAMILTGVESIPIETMMSLSTTNLIYKYHQLHTLKFYIIGQSVFFTHQITRISFHNCYLRNSNFFNQL